MKSMKRFFVISVALFCAAASMTACKSGGDNGGQPPQQLTGTVRHTVLNAKQIVSVTPPVSSATGTAEIALDTTGRLAGTVTLSNVTNVVTAVHINDGDPGNNGEPVVSLVETPAGSGTWAVPGTAAALTAAQVDRFNKAGFYISADTSANPSGEIRGQLLSYTDNIQAIFNEHCASCHYPLGQAEFTGLDLSPAVSFANLVNKPATRSTGARVVPFDADNSVMFQRISGTGFSSVVGPAMPLVTQAFPSLFTERDQNLLKAWINMGAIDNDGVAQQPQAAPTRQYSRNAVLNDRQVVTAPSVSSLATGTATMVLDTATSLLTGTVVLSSITNSVTAVHINDGDAGSNGDPVASLVETPAGSGVWTVPSTAPALTPVQMDRFISAGFYISVDTDVHPTGEIRGQIQTYKDNVQPIFNCRCVRCHQPFAVAGYTGLIFTADVSYKNLLGQNLQGELATQTTGTRVIPFDSVNSVLMQRLLGAGPAITAPTLRMPQDGPPFLSQHQENIIKVWIDTGAAND